MQEVSSNNTPSVLVEPPPHQPISNESSCPVAKTKRKARSTRRRLNAMMSNASLHFSDTDSEGELSVPRISTTNHSVKNADTAAANGGTGNLLHPVISVTLDGSDDSSYGCGNERRNSFLENLTDVDEIYTSEPENDAKTPIKSATSTPRGSLTVAENPHQGETDLEDMSNDEEEVVQAPIFIKLRSDILVDFNGETITTKEGDGPFSIEVRNQMSIDEDAKELGNDAPDIVVMPTTDSEDMEASDEEEEGEACGQSKESYEAFDVLAASQIVMRNVDKMEQQLLRVKSPSGGAEDGGISESNTDVEDFE